MKIYTLWHEGEGDDAPWIVDAADEYTLDEHNGSFPPAYSAKRDDPHVRELILAVHEKEVRALFKSPVVVAKVVTP